MMNVSGLEGALTLVLSLTFVLYHVLVSTVDL